MREDSENASLLLFHIILGLAGKRKGLFPNPRSVK